MSKVGQGIVLGGAVVAAGWAVTTSADGWADWVVFAVLVVFTFGAAVAVDGREHVRRKRVITRTSAGDVPVRRGGGGAA